MGIIVLVIIALIGVFAFLICDKGKLIASKLKEHKIKDKALKEKPVKEKSVKSKKEKKEKEELPQDDSQQVDYDTMIKEDNVEFNKEPLPSEIVSYDLVNQPSKLFVEPDENEDIDLDKMFEELNMNSYKKNDLEQDPDDLDAMGFNDMDAFIEQSYIENNDNGVFGNYGLEEDLTGAELGNAIRNLPKSVKVLIISEFLKRKF